MFKVKWGIKNEIEINRFGCHTFTSYVLNLNLNFNEFDTPLTGLFSDNKLQ